MDTHYNVLYVMTGMVSNCTWQLLNYCFNAFCLTFVMDTHYNVLYVMTGMVSNCTWQLLNYCFNAFC
jgi:hypothetical protein